MPSGNISISRSFFTNSKTHQTTGATHKLTWKCGTTNDLLTIFESLVVSPPSEDSSISALKISRTVVDLLPRDFIGEKRVELRILDVSLPFEMICLDISLNSEGRYDLKTDDGHKVTVREVKRRCARKLVMMVYSVDIGISNI